MSASDRRTAPSRRAAGAANRLQSFLSQNDDVNVTLVEIDPPVGDRVWFPFSYEEAGRGFTLDWWYRGPVYPGSRRTFLRGLKAGDEVARIELDDAVGIDHYAGVPHLGFTGLEFQFIEVRADHRLRGIGHAVIDRLYDRYPDCRLVAFSEDADGFWSSLGWDRHVHAEPEQARFYGPLYIQPAK